MKIKELVLYTKSLQAEKDFYKNTLGFEIVEDKQTSFAAQIGNSILRFEKSDKQYYYHYCFLIPRNKLPEALVWLQKRLKVINIEKDRVTQIFDSWNAESVYFYDASGNVAELIVRYDLENDSDDEFTINSIININEIGLGSSKSEQLNKQLESELGSMFWKGDKIRFGTNGSQEGIFLLPNYKYKALWFPTRVKVAASPIKAIIAQDMKKYSLIFENEELKIIAL